MLIPFRSRIKTKLTLLRIIERKCVHFTIQERKNCTNSIALGFGLPFVCVCWKQKNMINVEPKKLVKSVTSVEALKTPFYAYQLWMVDNVICVWLSTTFGANFSITRNWSVNHCPDEKKEYQKKWLRRLRTIFIVELIVFFSTFLSPLLSLSGSIQQQWWPFGFLAAKNVRNRFLRYFDHFDSLLQFMNVEMDVNNTPEEKKNDRPTNQFHCNATLYKIDLKWFVNA